MKLNSFSLFVSCLLLGVMTLALGLSQPVFLERIGLSVYDVFQRRFPAQTADQVALILVDTSSVQALANEQRIYFPFPRALYAEFITAAKNLQARALGLDIVFSEPSARGPEDDQAFADAIETAGFPVVFATGAQAPDPASLYRNLKNLRWGNTDVIQSPDGLFRRGAVDSSAFASQIISPLNPGFSTSHQGWVHFGKREEIPRVPFYNVLQSQFDPALRGSLEPLLKGKVWIVGYSSPGLLDLKPTPVDADSAGPFIQASLVQNLMSHQGGVHPFKAVGFFLVFLVLVSFWHVGLFLLQPRIPSVLLALVFFTSFVVPVGISVLAWIIPRSDPFWVDPVPLALSMVAVTGLYFLVKVRRDWKDRIQFAKTIESSMSPQMLSLIERGEVQVKRYGEKREVCILFADLAGFTTLSEELEPEQLMELMNDYLDDAVQLIISRQGYVDKFIGDAIMALWGAPVSGVADVNDALNAALGFAAVTEACRKRWKEKYNYDFPIYTRVGIHFGSVVVGNLGSKDRFNYTALGDSVNLASRLEGVGKYYRQEITVSGELMDRATDEIRSLFFCVDVITVKGKDVPTRIYSSRANFSEAVLSKYEQAFSAYQKGEWDLALTELRSISEVSAEGAPGVISVLTERCQKLKQGHLRERFKDGVWSLDEK